ncbi:MAG: amidohydrolase [Chitinophagaceae bacterium]|nr:amidohydrolase [Chitinophagales bacterium]
MNTLTFTLIQTNLFWENKAANIQMLEEKINNIQPKTEVVVLPEMFSTGFSMQPEQFAESMNGSTLQWMQKIAFEKKTILTGSLMIEENGNYYNRLIWMLPNKQFGYYDKRHCFAFAKENEHYTAGNKRLIASVNGWKINVQICYDLRFPVWARQTMNNNTAEYDVLIYVANWPQRRSYAWKTLLTARAIENQCYVIGVNRIGDDGNKIYHSGDSMVINALGEILYHKENEEDVFTITLQKNELQEIRNKFPFLADADSFKIE